MFQRCHILFLFALVTCFVSQGQDVFAGFLTVDGHDLSTSHSESSILESSVFTQRDLSSSSVETSDADPVQESTNPLISKLGLVSPVGTGGSTSSNSTNSSQTNSLGVAAELSVHDLLQNMLCVYLQKEPRLRITIPFLLGIFRPPMSKV